MREASGCGIAVQKQRSRKLLRTTRYQSYAFGEQANPLRRHVSADPPLAPAATYQLRLRLRFHSLKTPASRTATYTFCPPLPLLPRAHPRFSLPQLLLLRSAWPTASSSTLSVPPGYQTSHRSHGCPQVLPMDVRTLSGHLAAHCRESHSRVRLSLCLWPCAAPTTQLTMTLSLI